MGDDSSIKEKDILDLAWKYFQQHAQQRLSYFNFFVVFAALMTTGLLTTFQEKYDAHFIGIVIGLMLSLISFIFWKIDERNKFLTKHGENALKELEKHYYFKNKYDNLDKLKIFTTEAISTNELKENHKNIIFFRKQISHSKAFNIIFLVFFIIGLIGAITSTYYQIYHIPKKEKVMYKNKNIGYDLNTIFTTGSYNPD